MGFDLCISATNAQAWQYKTGSTNLGVTEGKVKRTMSVDLKTKFALLGYLIYHSYSRAVGDTFTDSKERRVYQKPIMDWLAIWPGLKIKVFEGFTFHVGNEVGGHCDSMNDHRKEHNRINFSTMFLETLEPFLEKVQIELLEKRSMPYKVVYVTQLFFPDQLLVILKAGN